MVPYFVHTNCGGQLYLWLKNLMILSTYGISYSTVTVGMAQILKQDESLPPGFFCVECRKQIPNSEISGWCSHCKIRKPVQELYKIVSSLDFGGIYCDNCLKNDLLAKYDKRLLSEILEIPFTYNI